LFNGIIRTFRASFFLRYSDFMSHEFIDSLGLGSNSETFANLDLQKASTVLGVPMESFNSRTLQKAKQLICAGSLACAMIPLLTASASVQPPVQGCEKVVFTEQSSETVGFELATEDMVNGIRETAGFDTMLVRNPVLVATSRHLAGDAVKDDSSTNAEDSVPGYLEDIATHNMQDFNEATRKHEEACDIYGRVYAHYKAGLWGEIVAGAWGPNLSQEDALAYIKNKWETSDTHRAIIRSNATDIGAGGWIEKRAMESGGSYNYYGIVVNIGSNISEVDTEPTATASTPTSEPTETPTQEPGVTPTPPGQPIETPTSIPVKNYDNFVFLPVTLR
jgi:hypothetical protein